MLRVASIAGFVIASLALTSAVQAHTKVAATSPAANTAVAPTNKVSITFNESPVPAFSGADVTMTGMPGMANHSPMKISGLKPSWSADGKTLTLVAGRPFPKGTYQVSWRAAGADTHRVQGNYSFTVK